MKIFLSATSLRSDYGGPAYSVGRLATALAAERVKVGLWSPDASSVAEVLPADTGNVVRLGGPLHDALARFDAPDLIHDNGVWLRHNHGLAVFASRHSIPRVLSTRGMLEPWAMRHKKLKKLVAWQLYQKRDVGAAARLHATSDGEAANLQELGLDMPVSVIPNGVDMPALSEIARDRTPVVRTALFLGRIYPVKGLPMLVEAWSRSKPDGWRLIIAGPDEAGHRAGVERLIAQHDLTSVISFTGPVTGDEKRKLFLSADLFVLPSHSESFGMAVAESLSYAVPVLTTTAAPWEGLEDQRCGWRVAPTVPGIADGLRLATSTSVTELRAMGSRGRVLTASDYDWSAIARRFAKLYEELLG